MVRQALRAYISEAKRLEELKGNITATITIIYKKKPPNRKKAATANTTSTTLVLTFLHTHIEEGYCIKVIVAKGEAQTMKNLINSLKNKQASLRSQSNFTVAFGLIMICKILPSSMVISSLLILSVNQPILVGFFAVKMET